MTRHHRHHEHILFYTVSAALVFFSGLYLALGWVGEAIS